MKRKILFILLIITIIISGMIQGVQAATDINDIDDIKAYLESNSNGQVDVSELLQAYKNLSANYTNDEIATELEKNKSLLESKGISEDTINSGTKLLRAVDEKQLNKILSEDINIDEIQEKLEKGSSPTEILDNVQQQMSLQDKISLVLKVFFAFWFVKLAIAVGVVLAVYNIILRWIIFNKAGKNGWAAIIPIYRDAVMYKICGVSPWLLLLLLVPIIGWFILLIVNIFTKFTLAEGFGKGIGFGFGIWLLGPIFESIIAFSKKTTYIGFEN